MRLFALALMTSIGLSTTPSVYAQATGDAAAFREKLKPGDRVTSSLDDTVVRGTLLAIGTDTLVVRSESGQMDGDPAPDRPACHLQGQREQDPRTDWRRP
jgi:hypothetical protein